jgi:hypothetical protein
LNLRKHSVALVALGVFHFVFFFPVLYMGRVVSPNDVFRNYDPWSFTRHVPTQNSLINDPPTSYYTLMSLAKHDPAAFNWNPFVASGIPGWGSTAAAVLSPFVLIPVLTVPLPWVYTALIFLKLNAAFWFAYFWLREERLGKRGAAIGALVVAAAGVVTVRWLWQSTNASALYPALLWLVCRAFNGKRNSIAWMIVIALAYALAGFPAAMAYGAYVSLAYTIFLAIKHRGRHAGSLVVRGAIAAIIALMIAAPSLVPYVQLLRRTGYLETRGRVSIDFSFPLKHARLFLFPDALGNNAFKNWVGDPQLRAFNNYYEATLYLGVTTIVLLMFSFFARRRARSRWFWLATLVILLAAMFGGAPFLGYLPGIKYSWLTRLTIVLPLPAGYLAAAGASFLSRRRAIAFLIAAAVAWDLGLFAGRFYPYLDPSEADVPVTPTIAFLQSQPRPYRVAPMMNYMFPNSSELFRIEDARSHFSSEAKYRQLLQRIDPSVWGGFATVLEFDSRTFNFADPLVSMLGVRYVIEHKAIDIIKWSIFGATKPGVAEKGGLTLKPGAIVQRTITVDGQPFYAAELAVGAEPVVRAGPHLEVQLIKGNTIVYQRNFTPDDCNAIGKIYVPVSPYLHAGESAVLRLRPLGMRANMLGAADGSFFFGRVTTPLIFDRELPDGRIFRNLAEVPRFHPASRLRKMSDEEMLARSDFDFAQEAVVASDSKLDAHPTDARIERLLYGDSRQELAVASSSPWFLASSEKLTPELRITIDGAEAKIVPINILFAGVSVPSGRHTIVFERRIGRGWWWVAGLGVLAFFGIAFSELRRRG